MGLFIYLLIVIASFSLSLLCIYYLDKTGITIKQIIAFFATLVFWKIPYDFLKCLIEEIIKR